MQCRCRQKQARRLHPACWYAAVRASTQRQQQLPEARLAQSDRLPAVVRHGRVRPHEPPRRLQQQAMKRRICMHGCCPATHSDLHACTHITNCPVHCKVVQARQCPLPTRLARLPHASEPPPPFVSKGDKPTSNAMDSPAFASCRTTSHAKSPRVYSCPLRIATAPPPAPHSNTPSLRYLTLSEPAGHRHRPPTGLLCGRRLAAPHTRPLSHSAPHRRCCFHCCSLQPVAAATAAMAATAAAAAAT